MASFSKDHPVREADTTKKVKCSWSKLETEDIGQCQPHGKCFYGFEEWMFHMLHPSSKVIISVALHIIWAILNELLVTKFRQTMKHSISKIAQRNLVYFQALFASGIRINLHINEYRCARHLETLNYFALDTKLFMSNLFQELVEKQ